jgi:hypothetical protein
MLEAKKQNKTHPYKVAAAWINFTRFLRKFQKCITEIIRRQHSFSSETWIIIRLELQMKKSGFSNKIQTQSFEQEIWRSWKGYR